MRKCMTFMTFLLVCTLLAACGKKAESPALTMTASEVTREGLQLTVFADGLPEDAALLTGRDYRLERREDIGWRSLDTHLWDYPADLLIAFGQDAEEWGVIDWSRRLGSLEPGTYRIGKTFSLPDGTGGEQTQQVWVEFIIE